MKTYGKSLLVLACMLALSGPAFAQTAPIDFEPGGNGGSWTWAVFENDTNPALEFVANPDAAGINASATAARFTALKTGAPWAGCETQHGADIGTFALDESNCTVKIMVYKTVISDVGIKFATASGASTGEIKVANTLVNQWEELVFDFSGKLGQPESAAIDQIIVFPDFDLAGRAADNVILFDNITFAAKISTQDEPTVPAPAPTADPSNVISLYSNAYANVPVDTWSAVWDNADVADIQIVGDDTKKYTNLVFAGIEFTSQLIDATEMTHFHMDFWTPDPTAEPAAFRIKLVDFGADAAYGGGDDVEHELTLTASTVPALASKTWVGIDIPFSSFVGLTTRGHLAQLIISGDPKTVYLDNIYFRKAQAEAIPTVAAPVPTANASDVISLFSNAYSNVTVDTWSAVWDNADLTEMQVAGDDTKKYSNLVFAGIEFTSQPVNATDMTHFHMDFWTPDPTAEPVAFRIKLVDFGADGAYAGGDDVEHELTLTASTSPGLASETWVGLDIPFSAFANLTTRGHLAQLIISGDPKTVYIDNVYFHKASSTAVDEGSAPFALALAQNFPNPFNPSTSIVFTVPESQPVTLKVYNALGEEVATLVDEFKTAGTHLVTFDGARLPSGVYSYAITAGGVTSVRLMTLLK